MLTTIWCNILQGLHLVFYHFFPVLHSFRNLCCNFLCVVQWLPTNFIRTQIALAFGVAEALQSWQNNTKNEELIKRQSKTKQQWQQQTRTVGWQCWRNLKIQFENATATIQNNNIKITKKNILAFVFSMNKIGNSWNATHGTAAGHCSNSKSFRFLLF